MTTRQATLWLARFLSKDLDLDDPDDAQLWRMLSLEFNQVWGHVVPRLSGKASPDWDWVARQARKAWSSYEAWQQRTGRQGYLDWGTVVRVGGVLLRAAHDVRDRRVRIESELEYQRRLTGDQVALAEAGRLAAGDGGRGPGAAEEDPGGQEG